MLVVYPTMRSYVVAAYTSVLMLWLCVSGVRNFIQAQRAP